MRTKQNTMTMRVSDELKSKLDLYAKLSGRSVSYVATAAMDEYLAWRIPQIKDLEDAIKAAAAGELASKEDVDRFFAKYGC